jgi:multisubunit Na+/H+ antiporter MnhF subunit
LTPWIFGSIALIVGGFVPALWLSSRGKPEMRLVGLEFAAVVTILILTLLAKQYGRTSFLIVPLALAVASFPGSLVFARLLVPRR